MRHVAVFQRRRGGVANVVHVYRLRAALGHVERKRPGAAVFGQTTRGDGVGLARLHGRGQKQVDPVFVGVVGLVVDAAYGIAAPTVADPAKLGAFAFAANLRGVPAGGVVTVARTADAVLARLHGLRHVQLVAHHHFVGSFLAFLVVNHVAIVEVDEDDFVGQRSHLYDIGGPQLATQQHTGQQGQVPQQPVRRCFHR